MCDAWHGPVRGLYSAYAFVGDRERQLKRGAPGASCPRVRSVRLATRARGRRCEVAPGGLARRVTRANVAGQIGDLLVVEDLAKARHVAKPFSRGLVDAVQQNAQQVVWARLAHRSE